MGAPPLVLPPRARAFLVTCIVVGVAAILAAAGSLVLWPPQTPWPLALGGTALLAAAILVLQWRSPGLHWRGRTIGVHLDEGLILVAFVLLPPASAVLAPVAATLVTQARLGKHPLKATFNVSTQATSHALAALAFLGLVELGANRVGAALVVPFVVSLFGLGLVAILLSLLEGMPARHALKPMLLASVVLTSITGAAIGILALGLWAFHPAAPLLLVPLGWLIRKGLLNEYRHQNELTARRALQAAHERLVVGEEEGPIVEAGLAACAQALDVVSCEVEVDGRVWRSPPGVPTGRTRLLSVPIVVAEGRPVGAMRALVTWNGKPRLEEDRATLALLSSSLGMALATADALRSLREARRGLRDVLDAADEPIVAWDPDGRTVHANEAARAAFGDTDRAGFAALLEPASAQAFDAAMQAPARERAEVEAWTLAGRVLEVRKGPIALAEGRVGTLLVARDVTERHRLEREAEEQRERVVRAERFASIGILAAGVAHEINSPLMFVQGNLELTDLDLEESDPEGKDETVVRMRRQVAIALGGLERIRRITHGLGVLGRPERAKPRAGADVGEALHRGVEEARRGLPGQARCEERSQKGAISVDADPADLRQIAYHLARNAFEAAGPDGLVVATARAAGGWAEMVFEDDGPGVPPEERAKLFTPFHTTKPEGTGLGLPIALALARSMGGDVTHEPGERGARFRVRIPLRGAETQGTRRLLTPDT